MNSFLCRLYYRLRGQAEGNPIVVERVGNIQDPEEIPVWSTLALELELPSKAHLARPTMNSG